MFVNHQFHDLNMLQAGDGLPIDVCHKVALSQATLPRRSFLVHLLQRHNKGFDITYMSFVQYTCILYNLLHIHVQPIQQMLLRSLDHGRITYCVVCTQCTV